MILLIFALSIISAIFYRAGGMGQDVDHWIPKWMRQGWVRDWLCPFCCLFPLLMIQLSWWFILAYVLLGAAFTTYWDWLFNDWDNFWFSGFMCGIAAFPLLFCGFLWQMFLIRAFFIAIAWGIITTFSGNDFFEEYGRGFTVSISSLIFLL